MIKCDKFNLNGCQITTLTQFKAHFGVGFGSILTFSYKSDQTGLIQMFCGSPLLISRLKMWCLSSYESEWNIWTFSISSVWSPIPRVNLGWETTLVCTLSRISNCRHIWWLIIIRVWIFVQLRMPLSFWISVKIR